MFESNLTELDFCTKTLIYDINNLENWAKDEKSPDVPFDMKILRPKIRKDPLGTVLIIGSVAPNTIMYWPSGSSVAHSCIGPIISLSIS